MFYFILNSSVVRHSETTIYILKIYTKVMKKNHMHIPRAKFTARKVHCFPWLLLWWSKSWRAKHGGWHTLCKVGLTRFSVWNETPVIDFFRWCFKVAVWLCCSNSAKYHGWSGVQVSSFYFYSIFDSFGLSRYGSSYDWETSSSSWWFRMVVEEPQYGNYTIYIALIDNILILLRVINIYYD